MSVRHYQWHGRCSLSIFLCFFFCSLQLGVNLVVLSQSSFFQTTWSFLVLSILLFTDLYLSVSQTGQVDTGIANFQKKMCCFKIRESKMMSKAIDKLGQTQKLRVDKPILIFVAHFLCWFPSSFIAVVYLIDCH